MLKNIHFFQEFIREHYSNFLPIPRCSFICKFNEPFVNQQKQRIINVKTALFNKNIFCSVEIKNFLLNQGWKKNIFMVYPGEYINEGKYFFRSTEDLNVYMISVKALGTYNVRLFEPQNLFIFVGFPAWSHITMQMLHYHGILLSGGDSSRRHLISNLSINLLEDICLLTALSLGELESAGLRYNIPGGIVKPRHDLTKFKHLYIDPYKDCTPPIEILEKLTITSEHFSKVMDIPNFLSIEDKNRENSKLNWTQLEIDKGLKMDNKLLKKNRKLFDPTQKRYYHSQIFSGFNSPSHRFSMLLPMKHINFYMCKCLYSTNSVSSITSTPEEKNLTNSGFSELVFVGIVDIIKNNPVNRYTQIKLEKFIRNQFMEFLTNKEKNPIGLGLNSEILNSKFNNWVFDRSKELYILLKTRRDVLNSKVFNNIDSLNNKNLLDYISKDIMNNLKINDYINMMIYVLLFTVTHSNIFNDDDELDYNTKTNLLNISLMLGKNIISKYINNLYTKHIKTMTSPKKEEIPYSSFKQDIINKYLGKKQNLSEDELYLHIGSYLIEIMRSCGMVDLKVHKSGSSSITILVLGESVKSLVGNNINRAITIPFDLPMIVKPNECNKDTGGGYLLNDIEYHNPLISEKITYGIPSEIQDNNKVFYTLNRMMSTPYRINKELLNYLISFNHIHKLLIDPDFQHEYANINRDKYKEREYQRFLSHKLLQEYIIKIAQTFSSVPEIYFPIKLDHRGRLYPRSVYFNYQSTELAKALLEFAKPDSISRSDIESIEYLKAYGANCFGNGLNKKSYTKRIEWVNNNWNDILNFENNDLVSKADDKFLFLAFCFELKRYDNFLNNENVSEFKTYIPIQLDGTCNGFQHLAMLANETKLFETLNLYSSSKKDDPKDFYQTIVDQVNLHLEMKLRELNQNIDESELKESYNRLLKVGINRKIVKPAIMNKPYNATNRTLVKYIKDLLEFVTSDNIIIKDKDGEEKEYKRGWYKIPTTDQSNNNLINHKDIEILVNLIMEIIYVKYPKIKELNNYLRDIVNILNKLNLPVIWRLPSGLKVSQNYLPQKRKKIKPFTYLKNSITITTTIKDSIDKKKQITAFMPNLVHSLDASTLSLLYFSFYKSIIPESYKTDKFVNFYSVHDCYGVTAKYAEMLINILRSIYIQLYSNERFINKFDQDIIDFIKESYGDSCSYNKDKRILTVNDIKYNLPTVSNLIVSDNNSYESLSKAIYLIN